MGSNPVRVTNQKAAVLSWRPLFLYRGMNMS